MIIDNLLGNAVKYGKQGGNIYIRWDVAQHCMVVADDGPGIPSKYLPYLFDRFFRTDASRSSRVEGNGLGLAIVKKIADIQNIQISVQSEEGSGTEFRLFFRKEDYG